MSELKQNVTPDLQDPPEVERPRQRARTMSRKEMARQFRQQMAAGGVDPELQTLMAEIEATRPKSRADCGTARARVRTSPASSTCTSMSTRAPGR